MTDAIAREHNKSMDVPGYQEGDYKNPEYIFEDIIFVKRLEKYIKESQSVDYIDPYTKRRPSEESIKAANLTKYYFRLFVFTPKEREMYDRYKQGEITLE